MFVFRYRVVSIDHCDHAVSTKQAALQAHLSSMLRIVDVNFHGWLAFALIGPGKCRRKSAHLCNRRIIDDRTQPAMRCAKMLAGGLRAAFDVLLGNTLQTIWPVIRGQQNSPNVL
jgi:hypothetical protein